jgi:hypothetical protein
MLPVTIVKYIANPKVQSSKAMRIPSPVGSLRLELTSVQYTG